MILRWYVNCRGTLLNIPFGIIFVMMLTLLGLIIYAYFADIQCDPLANGDVNNANEVILICSSHFLNIFLSCSEDMHTASDQR